MHPLKILFTLIVSMSLGMSIALQAQVWRNDFLVNDDVGSNLAQTEEVRIACNQSGSYVVVWRDERAGDYDLWARLFDANDNPRGSSFRINDDASQGEHWDPDVAIDDAGNFVVSWGVIIRDYNLYFELYARRFDANGTPLGASFQVNDDTLNNYNNLPAVAMNPSNGNFVIAWNDNRDDNYDIWAQRYLADGTPQGVNFKVNTDGETNWGIKPPVAGMDQNGDFVIAWNDDRRSGMAGVWFQQYQADGTPVGTNRIANDTISGLGDTPAFDPEMTMNRAGAFVITWQDFRSGSPFDPDVYAQLYDTNGQTVGSNFKVNDDQVAQEQKEMCVGMDDAGAFVIAFWDERNSLFGDIYAQRYDASATPLASNFLVDDYNGLGLQEQPNLALAGNGDFVVLWNDDRGDNDIIAASYLANGTLQGSTYLINDDTGGGKQEYPALDLNRQGEFAIAWQDDRDEPRQDIFLQLFHANGLAKCGNIKVNDDNQNFIEQTFPAVAIDGQGKSVVVWRDARNGGLDLYGQRYDHNGNPLGANFKVSPSGSSVDLSSVAMDTSGNFVVVWDDYGSLEGIYMQRYASDGTAQGSAVQVPAPTNRNPNSPHIDINAAGDFVITWDQNYGIHAQRYAADGSEVGTIFKVSDHVGSANYLLPGVGLDDLGNFVIVWTDDRNRTSNQENRDIYLQQYDYLGTPIDTNIRVNDDTTLWAQQFASVAMDPAGGRFVVVWQDFRHSDYDPEIMAQRFDNGSPVDTNILINVPDLFPYHHQSLFRLSVACNSNNVAYTWMDNRRLKHWDIYGKLTDWSLMVGLEDELPAEPLALKAYPNPFSEQIWIEGLEIEAEVRDLHGKWIAFTHEGTWTGRDWMGREVPAGVYLLLAEGYPPLKVWKTE